MTERTKTEHRENGGAAETGIDLQGRDRMRADLANELNNALGAALTMIEVLLEDPQATGAREAMLAVRHEVRRAAELAGDFIGLARPRPPRFDELGLNGVLRKALSIVGGDLAFHGLAPRLEPDPRLPMIRGDYHQVLEAVVNAVHFLMLLAGRRDAAGSAAKLRLATSAESGRILLAIETPAGREIPLADLQAHAAELALTRRVMEAHRGRLHLGRGPGHSHRLTLDFPGEALTRLVGIATPIRDRAILVVDDEPAVRSSLARLLGGKGNAVTTAVSADEALRILATGGFDLVLVDHSLPDLGGAGLLAEARRRRPASFGAGVVMSGREAEEIDLGGEVFLKKPFAGEELWRALAEAEARRAAAGARTADATDSPSDPASDRGKEKTDA